MIFQFPFSVDISKTRSGLKRVPVDKKYICDGINVLDYLTVEEVEACREIVVFNTRLCLYKGSGIYEPNQLFSVVDEKLENRKEKLDPVFVYIDVKGGGRHWKFNDLTSGYTKERNQHYVKVELEEETHELDVLGFAAGLDMYYGVHFLIHTVSEDKGIYHLTLDNTFGEVNGVETEDVDSYVDIFNDISKRKDEIHEMKALYISVGVNKKNTEPNEMPAPKYEWDW